VAGAKPLVAAGVFALAASATALAGSTPPFRPNAADQAAARATLLKASDLGAGWTGGVQAAGKPSPPSCPGFAPREDDLPVTGHALAAFQKQGVDVESDVEVLRTAAMVRTDFSRTIRPPLARCLAVTFEQQSGSGTTIRVVSSKKVAFPAVAPVTVAYRVTSNVTQGSRTVKIVVDFVFMGKNRTEMTLTVTARSGAERAMTGFEQRLARVLAGRARA
jgi:hypothetical protein